MRARYGFVSAAALALVLAAPALAQTPRQSMPNDRMTQQDMGKQKLSQQDMKFIKEAANGGMAEVELGKLAEQKGQDNQVKQFGQRMEQDHGNANSQLMSIADTKGINLPRQLDQKHMQLRDRLSRLQGTAFDRAYMREETKDHDADVKAFRREAQTTKDPDLQRFAQDTLNTIQQHDQLAHNIDQSLTATGSSMPPRR